MRHVAQPEADQHPVERMLRERQRLGVALDRRHVGDARVQQPVAAEFQHAGVDVAQRHAAVFAEPRPRESGDIRGAARQVQQPQPRAQLRQQQQHALPVAVRAERHQVVHQVVAERHRVEHLGHPAPLLVRLDLGVAEVRHAASSRPRAARRRPPAAAPGSAASAAGSRGPAHAGSPRSRCRCRGRR